MCHLQDKLGWKIWIKDGYFSKLKQRLIFWLTWLLYLACCGGERLSNQSVLVRTVNDNWYVCLLSSLCCRSWSHQPISVCLHHQPGPGWSESTQVESMETTINVVAMDVNHGQVESDWISNIKYVALPWTLEQKTSWHFHGQISIFDSEVWVVVWGLREGSPVSRRERERNFGMNGSSHSVK